MWLFTKSKNQTLIQSCIKYQKLYSTKLKLFSKLLVCLLAINYHTTAATAPAPATTTAKAIKVYHKLPTVNFNHSATGTCFLGVAMHATPTSVVTKGIGIISKEGLDKGTIAIDPANMKLSHMTPLSVYLDGKILGGCQQEVDRVYIYEYISNHPHTGLIDSNSSIYFGLTPALYSGDPRLGAFNYKASSTNYPALTIHTNEFNKRLTKSSTLKSIVVCTELSATNPVQDALYITGTNTTTILTDGLIIAKSAYLKGATTSSDKKAGLAFEDGFDPASIKGIKFKADIINYGTISGYCGVRINDNGNDSDFCLLPPHGGKTARFYNHGQVIGTDKAFKIMGQKRAEVDTFELTNKKDGVITGGLFLVYPTSTINFNVVNYGKIVTYATRDAVHITNYTGKAFSQLTFQFDKNSIGAIAHCGDSLHLEKGARIVLEVSGTINPLTKTQFTIAEASGSINLAQGSDMIVTLVNYGNRIIEASAINVTNSKIEATLTAVSASAQPAASTTYMPRFVPVVNARANIIQAATIAGAIDKLVSDPKTEIAGVNLNKFITNKDFQKSKIFNIAKDYNSSADEFFDILLPDSSNSQLSSNHAIANKIANQVSARLNGKAMAPIKTGSHQRKIDNLGITSGEVIDNVSVWTAFNYFQNKTKSNDDKQSYNNFKAMTFSLGTDGQLDYNDTTIGLSYGFCSGSNEIFGGSSGNKLSKTVPGIYDEEDLKTHTVTLYSAMNIQPVDMQVAFSFGSTKHTPKTGVNLKDYKSSIIGINFATTYPLDVEEFNIDFTGSLGVNIINTEEHEGKYNSKTNTKKIEKDSKSLVSLGLMAAFNDIVAINDNIELDYRFGIGGKYTISDDKATNIVVANKGTTKPTSIDYKKRQISPFNFNIDTNLNFQIQQNTHLGLDMNFGMGKASTEFGVAASVRYMF